MTTRTTKAELITQIEALRAENTELRDKLRRLIATRAEPVVKQVLTAPKRGASVEERGAYDDFCAALRAKCRELEAKYETHGRVNLAVGAVELYSRQQHAWVIAPEYR